MRRYRYGLCVLAVVGMAAGAAGVCVAAPAGEVQLHSLFTDNMVLQRGMAVPVWGTASAGGEVTVSFCGQSASAKADAKGTWMVRLKPLKAGGPFVMTVAGKETLTVKNVLVGDVWICSGQSNMEQGIGMCRHAKEEIAAANWPKIRLFMVPHHIATEPQTAVSAEWKVCTPQTVAAGGWGGFSGAAYYFGRYLHRELDVPIGLIQTCWGGTVAEAWTSAEALRTMGDFKSAVEQFTRAVAGMKSGDYSFRKEMERWWRTNEPGTAGGWAKAGLDDSAWQTMKLPQAWEKAGAAAMKEFDGVAWFRRTVALPAEWAGKDLWLELGPIDDRDTTFFNGESVGVTDVWTTLRKYRVPGKLVKAGANSIAIRVLDTGGGGGVWGGADQMKLSRVGNAPSPVSLAGEWRYKVSAPLGKLPSPPVNQIGGNPNVVTVLYNGMIAPLLPCAIKGAIWYQGESNAGHPMQYRRLLPTMIRDWRGRFQSGRFPFFIVQLANFMAVQNTPVQTGWAELREAQLLTAQHDPKVGLAVITDIGDARDIHPKNKQDVGKRLALSALALAYGKKLVYSGPELAKMTVEGNKAVLTFDHVGSGLTAKGGPLKGFALAGADGQFVWADATIDGKTVVVSSPKVPAPKAVRYNWANNPIGNLYNEESLPAGPFRTDGAPTE